jgi:hypothetical protein
MNSGTKKEKEVPDNYIFDLAEFFTTTSPANRTSRW